MIGILKIILPFIILPDGGIPPGLITSSRHFEGLQIIIQALDA